MPIQAIVEKLEDVPEKYRDLYAADGDKFKLVGVEGIRTQADIDRVMAAHTNEKTAHKMTKSEVAALREKGIGAKREQDGTYSFTYHERPLDEVFGELDTIPVLKAAADKAGNTPEKLNELVRPLLEKKIGEVRNPLDRQIRELTDKSTVLETENVTLKRAISNRAIGDEIQKAAAALKMLPEALEHVINASIGAFSVGEDDGKISTKDGVDVLTYLAGMKKNPNWSIFWPAGQGSGARGPGGAGIADSENPWSYAGWNITNQGKALMADPKGAEAMAIAAGHKGVAGARKPAAPSKK